MIKLTFSEEHTNKRKKKTAIFIISSKNKSEQWVFGIQSFNSRLIVANSQDSQDTVSRKTNKKPSNRWFDQPKIGSSS